MEITTRIYNDIYSVRMDNLVWYGGLMTYFAISYISWEQIIPDV